MNLKVTAVSILLLLSSSAFGQSYEMTIHLSSGGTVIIPNDDIQRIEFSHITGMQNPAGPGNTPSLFHLLRNYPNPFNPKTTIAYEMIDQAEVTVRIYNLKGALVKELLQETQEAGSHQVTWDGTDGEGARVSSGVYICSVLCGELALSQQLILVK